MVGAGGAALQPSDFQLIGSTSINASYQITGVSFDTTTNTAILTLGSFLARDKVLLHIADGAIENAAGTSLDGEWTTGNAGQSGDDTAGGEFVFRFDTLPGNVNNDALTSTTDLSAVRALGTQIAGSAGTFNARANVNGDLLVSTTDISAIRTLGTQFLIGVDDPELP